MLVREFARDGARAVVTGDAVVVDVARSELDGRLAAASRIPERGDLGQRQDLEVRLLADAALIDLAAASREAELREVLLQLGDAAAQIGTLLDEDHLLTGLGGREHGGHAADTTPTTRMVSLVATTGAMDFPPS